MLIKVKDFFYNLKYSVKTLKNLGLRPYSLGISINLLFGNKTQAINTAKSAFSLDPNNWPLCRFLLSFYLLSSKHQASVAVIDTFLSSYFTPSLCGPNSYSGGLDVANSMIDLFLLASSDNRDYSEIDFLGGLHYTKLSLHVSHVGRFSNFLIQLSNAIHIALSFGINNIYVSASPFLSDLFSSLKSVECTTANLRIHFHKPTEGFVVRGFYFHVGRQLINRTGLSYSLRNLVSIFRHATYFPQLQKTSIQHQLAINSDSKKNLVIHLRSGDIFGNNVHLEYGQPPLAYYIYAIEHYSPTSVAMVYEDPANPVIDALRLYLIRNNIAFSAHSSNLRSDLSVLIHASALVMSRGTFAYAALCFSDLLQTIYCFNSSYEPDPMMRMHLSAGFYDGYNCNHRPSIIEIYDRERTYFDAVCCKNWVNSRAQRNLMCSYPLDNLSVKYLV